MASPGSGHAIPRGVYTTKTRGPEIAYGSDAKPIPYAPSPYVPAYATASKRDALKGKQMSVPFSSKGFGKIEYVPSPYEDKSAKKTAGKLGFCSSKPFGRDDVSSMLDTLRYRTALEKEAQCIKAAAEAAAKTLAESAHGDDTLRAGSTGGSIGGASAPSSPARGSAAGGAGAGDAEGAMRSSGTLGSSLGSPGGGATSPKGSSLGLSGRLPKFSSQFDRNRHVPEFVPKVAYAERYDRDFGSMGTTNSAIGEGCGDLANISSPTSAKRDFTKAFADRTHLVSPSIAGRR